MESQESETQPDLSCLFDNELMSDVTIVFSGRRVRAHREILLRQSPYFKALFCGGYKDSGTREVELLEDDPDAVYALLRYMYAGRLPETQEAIPDIKSLIKFVVVADKYQVTTAAKAALIRHAKFWGGSNKYPTWCMMHLLPVSQVRVYSVQYKALLGRQLDYGMTFGEFNRSMLLAHQKRRREILQLLPDDFFIRSLMRLPHAPMTTADNWDVVKNDGS